MNNSPEPIKFRYRGPLSFSREDQEIFFGREEELSAIYTQLMQNRTFVLFGVSGLGKSSLIEAGILHTIEENTKFKPVVIKYGNYVQQSEITGEADPEDDKINTDQAEKYLLVNKTLDKISESLNLKVGSMLSELEIDEVSMFSFFKNLQSDQPSNIYHLLIFDQFEEIFSYPDQVISTFLDNLSELVNVELPNRFHEKWQKFSKKETSDKELRQKLEELLFTKLSIKCLFSIRSDYLFLLHRIEKYFPLVLSSSYELKSLTLKGAISAIRKPSDLVPQNGSFASPPFVIRRDAIELILRSLLNKVDKKETHVTPEDESTVTEDELIEKNITALLDEHENFKIESIQLQLICDHIEKEFVIAKNDLEITESDFIDDEGRKGEQYLQHIYQAYYTKTVELIADKKNRKAIGFVLEELVSEDAHKRIPVHESKLRQVYQEKKGSSFEADIKLLTDRHLVVRRGDDNTYQLVHDTFVKSVVDARTNRNYNEKYYLRRKKRYTWFAIIAGSFMAAFILLQTLKIMRESRLNREREMELKSDLGWAEIEKSMHSNLLSIYYYTAEEIKTDSMLNQKDLAVYKFLNNVPQTDSIAKLLLNIKAFRKIDSLEKAGNYTLAYQLGLGYTDTMIGNFWLEQLVNNRARNIMIDSLMEGKTGPDLTITKIFNEFKSFPKQFAERQVSPYSFPYYLQPLQNTSKQDSARWNYFLEAKDLTPVRVNYTNSSIADRYIYSNFLDMRTMSDSSYEKKKQKKINKNINWKTVKEIEINTDHENDPQLNKLLGDCESLETIYLSSGTIDLKNIKSGNLKKIFINADTDLKNAQLLSRWQAVSVELDLPEDIVKRPADFWRYVEKINCTRNCLVKNYMFISKCPNLKSLIIKRGYSYDEKYGTDTSDFKKRLELIFYKCRKIETLSTFLTNINELPENIRNLPIKELHMSLMNDSSLGIPETIRPLKNLETFSFQLSKNSLIKNDLIVDLKIPEWFTGFTKLKDITFQRCFNGPLQRIIGNFSSLERLDLGLNSLTSLPEDIGKLTKLKEIYLDGNDSLEIQGIPNSFRNLKNLESIDFSDTKIRAYPYYFTSFFKLRGLAIGNSF